MDGRREGGSESRGSVILAALAGLIIAGLGNPTLGDGDPIQVAKLLADDGTPADLFGYSVSLSGDLIVVGAYGDATAAGSAYVFAWDGAQWIQQAKLMADDGASYDFFGQATAIDGETVVIGAPSDDDHGVQSGSAYVFARSGNDWVQQAKLVADDASEDAEFGGSVAVEDDTIIIGAEGDGGIGPEAGAAYVFTRIGSEWIQEAKLLTDDQLQYDHLGCSVDLCGEMAVIGARKAGNPSYGAAYLFVRDGTTWTQQAKLMADDPEELDWFGCCVAISGDTIIVGAYGDDDNGFNSGSAYAFVRQGGAWTQQAKLLPDDGHGYDIYGWSADVSGDIAVIGSPGDSEGVFKSGSAYVWVRNGETWTQQAKFVSDDVDESDGFAESVALEQDRLVVGTPDDDDNGSSSGSAYVFDMGSACPADVTGDGVVDTADLLAVLAAWGPCEGCPEDINGDGIVSTEDLLILLAAWGECP